MNYIKQLQMQIEEHEEYIRRINEGIVDLQMYLMTEKFWNDTTVQVQDVINRLADVRSNASALLPDHHWKHIKEVNNANLD